MRATDTQCCRELIRPSPPPSRATRGHLRIGTTPLELAAFVYPSKQTRDLPRVGSVEGGCKTTLPRPCERSEPTQGKSLERVCRKTQMACAVLE